MGDLNRHFNKVPNNKIESHCLTNNTPCGAHKVKGLVLTHSNVNLRFYRLVLSDPAK